LVISKLKETADFVKKPAGYFKNSKGIADFAKEQPKSSRFWAVL
jgi:hypothetical protein